MSQDIYGGEMYIDINVEIFDGRARDSTGEFECRIEGLDKGEKGIKMFSGERERERGRFYTVINITIIQLGIGTSEL